MPVRRRSPWLRAAFLPGFLTARGGGAARSSCLQAASLAARGLPVAVEGLRDGDSVVPADLPLASCDVRVHPAVPGAVAVRSPALLQHLARRLGSLDVVHLNGNYDLLNYRVARMCVAAGVPYVVSARSLLDPAAVDLLPDGVRRHFARLEAAYLESAYAVHFTSEFERRRALWGGATPQRVVTIPNAVDLAHLARLPGRDEARAALGVPAGRTALLYFGRVVAQKRPEFAVRVLAATDPDADMHLYVVGSGTEADLAALRAEAARTGVADRVHLVGHAAGPTRHHWFAAADVLLLPSAAENFSLALVEAVASGLPAVVSPHIGALEFLRPDEATVVPPEPGAWARACTTVVAGARGNGDESFARLWNAFRPDRVIGDWLDLYDELPDPPATEAPAPGAVVDWAASTWYRDGAAVDVSPVAAGASSRQFFRLRVADRSAIAFTSPTRQGDYVSTPYDSTQPADWVRVSRLLHRAGLPVPRVLAYEQGHDWLLVDDFGDRDLDRHLADAPAAERIPWYVRALELVAHLQAATGSLAPTDLPMTRSLDPATLTWEFFHYVEWAPAMRAQAVSDADRVLLLREFGRIADELAGSGRVLTHRDYHAQNLMVRPDGSLGLLDFDDLLLGNPVYDLASFLLDAHAPADYGFVDDMVDRFHDVRAGAGLPPIPPGDLHRLFDLQAVQRGLKAAGRFGWLGAVAGRPEYLDSVPNLLGHVRHHLARQPDLHVLRGCLARYEPALGE
ncbi:MAG TPA: phosphotransferase [Actinocatenispora sp.]